MKKGGKISVIQILIYDHWSIYICIKKVDFRILLVKIKIDIAGWVYQEKLIIQNVFPHNNKKKYTLKNGTEKNRQLHNYIWRFLFLLNLSGRH